MICPIVLTLYLLQYCLSLLVGNVVEVQEIGVIVWYPHRVHELRGALNTRLFWCVKVGYSALGNGEKDARKRSRLLWGGCGDTWCQVNVRKSSFRWVAEASGVGVFLCFRVTSTKDSSGS
jgi:hypothetical protein